MSKTILKSATVKVMLSYDYNHFEASILLENEEGLTVKEIDDTRKDCARLCDKAIRQYKKAKGIAGEKICLSKEKYDLEREVEEIRLIKPENRLPEEKAKVKAVEDRDWELSWDYDDDMFDVPF